MSTNLLNNCLRFGLSTARGLLQQNCALCRAFSGDHLLCGPCHASLPRPASCCPRCAMPGASDMECGRCLARQPQFDATVAALLYAFPADRLVLALKYGARLPVADFFSRALEDALRARAQPPEVDLVVAMPLHPRRLAQRGFNQAAEIGRRLARRIGLPFSHTALGRIRDTPPQTELPVARRRANVRGAFAISPGMACRNIAVIDDVMTTGATADEAARALKRAGAARVEHWVVSRTWPGHR